MTSSDSKSAPAAPKPVTVLETQFSRLYVHLHPILLLSLICFGFTNLVRDPINTLLTLALPTAIVQAVYCVVCLPSTGQASSSALKPGQKKKAGRSAQELWAKLVPAFLSFLLTVFLSTPLFYTIVILFGGPLVSHLLQTFFLALHLALLVTPALFYVHGLDATVWRRLVSLQQPIDEVYGMSLGACLGAWLGAIPIPLDWDRDWQRWPVTVVCGLYLGAVVGKLAGGHLLRGTRVKMA